MKEMRCAICEECDSEIVFMDGSRCAACLSALHSDEINLSEESTSTYFDPLVGVQHAPTADTAG